MADYFIPSNHEEFNFSLITFGKALPGVATDLGFTAAEVAEAVADAVYMEWVVKSKSKIDSFDAAWQQFLYEVRYGGKGVITLIPPTSPVIDAMPTLVLPGIQARFAAKAAKAKANIKCTKSVQEQLGIASTSETVEHDKPDLKVKSKAGYVQLSFHRYEHQALNLYRDTDGKGYGSTPYKTLHKSPFVDKDLPEEGVAGHYKYKAIYLDGDTEVGSFSDEVGVSVVGR
jgi:hypothetical protein